MPWTSKYQQAAPDALQADWLDALSLLQPQLLRMQRAAETLRLVSMLPKLSPAVQVHGSIALTHYLLKREKNQHGTITLSLHPQLEHWYRVEKIEALLFVAALESWAANAVMLKDLDALCATLGCCGDNIADPRERWRRIGINRPQHSESGLAQFEDRPACIMCETPVSTGHHRKDAHDNCYIYGLQSLTKERRAEHLKAIRQVDPTKEGG